MGKPHYRCLHRVITTGRWSSSDPLHLNDNITSLHSFLPLVWPDDDPCGTTAQKCDGGTVEGVSKSQVFLKVRKKKCCLVCFRLEHRRCCLSAATGSWSGNTPCTATWHHQASKIELEHWSLAGWPPVSQIQTMWDMFAWEAYIYLSPRSQGHGSSVTVSPRVGCFEMKMSCKSDKRSTFQAVENWSWHCASSQTVNSTVSPNKLLMRHYKKVQSRQQKAQKQKKYYVSRGNYSVILYQ